MHAQIRETMKNVSSEKSVLVSTNPATLEAVGEVTQASPESVEDAVRQSREAFSAWCSLGLSVRSKILKRAQQLLLDRNEEIARWITLEMGRPFVESMVMELEASVDLIGYYADRSGRLLADRRLPLHSAFFLRRKSMVCPRPLGPIGVIAPWNWPLLIPLGCIIPALLAGNTVVFKPSELTPLVGQKIGEVLWEAGVPERAFHVVHGRGEIGRVLVDSDVEKVFFTGSTEVGQRIMVQAAASLRKVVLEMGGSDPAVVCDDVDLDFASSGVLWGGMNNCGQNCNSVERVFVQKPVLEGFLERLVDKAKRLRTGDGMALDTDVGPLASQAQRDKMRAIVQKCIDAKGRILCGGGPVETLPGNFFQPTIIHHDSIPPFLPNEEIFGPILIVIPVSDDEEAVRLANSSTFGLAASVWTGNPKRGEALAKQIDSGSVMVNDVVVSFGMSETNWTGIKKSGIGWVHGQKGMDEMVNLQYINRDPQDNMQKFWWFPYSQGMVKGIKAGMVFLHGSGLFRKMKAIPITLRHFTGYLLINRRRKDKW